MSESSNQQSAISNQHAMVRPSPQNDVKIGRDLRVLLNADCRLLIAASRTAIRCTVTRPDTSVTILRLAESGLIIVGRAIGRWAKTAANRGFAWVAHCSFKGGMCIQ
jgi:hypothetical protein